MSSNKSSNTLGLFTLVLGLFFLWSLVGGLKEIKQAYKRVDEAEKILEEEELKNLELKSKFDKVQTGEYMEEIIRGELKMQKEGEVVVVLPENGSRDEEKGVILSPKEENWQKWWSLIK